MLPCQRQTRLRLQPPTYKSQPTHAPDQRSRRSLSTISEARVDSGLTCSSPQLLERPAAKRLRPAWTRLQDRPSAATSRCPPDWHGRLCEEENPAGQGNAAVICKVELEELSGTRASLCECIFSQLSSLVERPAGEGDCEIS